MDLKNIKNRATGQEINGVLVLITSGGGVFLFEESLHG
jgi:hypothetical protein